MRTIAVLASLLLLFCACSGTDDPITADLKLPDATTPDGPSADLAAPDAAGPDAPLHDSQAPDVGAVPATKWIKIVPGTFTMGSPATEPCRQPDTARETQHKVTLTRSFELAATEVTQTQFLAAMWYNPAKHQGCGDCPVEKLSWHEAVAYCNQLSLKASLARCYSCKGSGKGITCDTAAAHSGAKILDCPGYRLPTEAEWEYAYRAGSSTALYNGTISDCIGLDQNASAVGWFEHNSGGKSHPIKQKKPNAWGLYDLAGSVWEWCHDWYKTDLGTQAATDPFGSNEKIYRLIRGGSWFGKAYNLRAARRFQKETTYRCHGIGFRCARTLTP